MAITRLCEERRVIRISRKQLAVGLVLLLPLVSVVLLSVLPWGDWFPRVRNLGRPWLYATIALGAVGLLLLPMRPMWKVGALILYLPAMFLFLAYLSVVLVCLAHGPHACP